MISSLSQVLQSGGSGSEFFLFRNWQELDYKQTIPQFLVSSICSTRYLLFLLYKFQCKTTPIGIHSSDLLFLLQGMLPLQYSISFVLEQTVSHKYFSLLPVDFQVIVFKLGVTKYEILLPQTKDYKKHLFQVRVITEDNVYYLRYLVYFVRRSIYVEYRYRVEEALRINLSSLDEVLIDKATYCTTVKQNCDRVGFSSICCEDLYKQNEGHVVTQPEMT